MSKRQIVERYLDGFRRGDQAKILECLSDDVVWRLHGCKTFHGKSEFFGNIDNEEFCELPRLEIRELIESENRVVAVGSGAIREESGSEKSFTFCEVFRFDDELVTEVETFHIWND